MTPRRLRTTETEESQAEREGDGEEEGEEGDGGAVPVRVPEDSRRLFNRLFWRVEDRMNARHGPGGGGGGGGGVKDDVIMVPTRSHHGVIHEEEEEEGADFSSRDEDSEDEDHRGRDRSTPSRSKHRRLRSSVSDELDELIRLHTPTTSPNSNSASGAFSSVTRPHDDDAEAPYYSDECDSDDIDVMEVTGALDELGKKIDEIDDDVLIPMSVLRAASGSASGSASGTEDRATSTRAASDEFDDEVDDVQEEGQQQQQLQRRDRRGGRSRPERRRRRNRRVRRANRGSGGSNSSRSSRRPKSARVQSLGGGAGERSRTHYPRSRPRPDSDSDSYSRCRSSRSQSVDLDFGYDRDLDVEYYTLLSFASNCVRRIFVKEMERPNSSPTKQPICTRIRPKLRLPEVYLATTYNAFLDEAFARRWPALERLSRVISIAPKLELPLGRGGGRYSRSYVSAAHRRVCDRRNIELYQSVFSLKKKTPSELFDVEKPMGIETRSDLMSFVIQAEQLRDLIEKYMPIMEYAERRESEFDSESESELREERDEDEEEEGEHLRTGEEEEEEEFVPTVLLCCDLDVPSSPTVSPQHFRRGTSSVTPRSMRTVLSRDDGPRVACVALALAFCMRQERISFRDALSKQRRLRLKQLDASTPDGGVDVDFLWEDEGIPQFVASVLRDYESQGWSFAAERLKRQRDFREAVEWGRMEKSDFEETQSLRRGRPRRRN